MSYICYNSPSVKNVETLERPALVEVIHDSLYAAARVVVPDDRGASHKVAVPVLPVGQNARVLVVAVDVEQPDPRACPLGADNSRVTLDDRRLRSLCALAGLLLDVRVVVVVLSARGRSLVPGIDAVDLGALATASAFSDPLEGAALEDPNLHNCTVLRDQGSLVVKVVAHLDGRKAARDVGELHASPVLSCVAARPLVVPVVGEVRAFGGIVIVGVDIRDLVGQVRHSNFLPEDVQMASQIGPKYMLGPILDSAGVGAPPTVVPTYIMAKPIQQTADCAVACVGPTEGIRQQGTFRVAQFTLPHTKCAPVYLFHQWIDGAERLHVRVSVDAAVLVQDL